MIIGLCGVAGSGKDSFYNFCSEYLFENKPCIRFAFADALKKDIEKFLIKEFGINPFTENRREKEIIRPLLVGYGMSKRNFCENYWIDKISDEVKENSLNNICFITDVRFHNEVDRIHELGGFCIYIKRNGVGPANQEEELNDPIVKSKCDFSFEWNSFPSIKSFKKEAKHLAFEFIKNILTNERV
jgi:hypothetical protein